MNWKRFLNDQNIKITGLVARRLARNQLIGQHVTKAQKKLNKQLKVIKWIHGIWQDLKKNKQQGDVKNRNKTELLKIITYSLSKPTVELS